MSARIFLFALLTLLMVACQTTENKAPNTGEGIEYIVNPHDFGDYKKFDYDKSANELKTEEQTNQKKTDSLQSYLKKLAHNFRLQKTQLNALEYIYEKYEQGEKKIKARNDTTEINTIIAEREKRIKLVLGEASYARKAAFDSNYENSLLSPVGLLNEAELNTYLNELAAAISINDTKKEAFKRLVNSYDKSIVKAKPKAVTVLKSRRKEAIKNLLGDDLYNKKLAFDKNHPKPVN